MSVHTVHVIVSTYTGTGIHVYTVPLVLSILGVRSPSSHALAHAINPLYKISVVDLWYFCHSAIVQPDFAQYKNMGVEYSDYSIEHNLHEIRRYLQSPGACLIHTFSLARYLQPGQIIKKYPQRNRCQANSTWIFQSNSERVLNSCKNSELGWQPDAARDHIVY